MLKIFRKLSRAASPFFKIIPFIVYKLFKTRSYVELIEFREWVYLSIKVLNNISTSSQIARYRSRSEQGELFGTEVAAKLATFGVKGLGVLSNNAYLNGGGYRESAKIAVEKFLKYEEQREIRGLQKNSLQIFGPEWASSIGHSTKLTILPKLRGEDSRVSNRILIYNHAANHFFLSLLADHYSLLCFPEELKSLLVTYVDDCLHPLDAIRSSEGEALDLYSAMTLAERKWNRTNGQNVFLQLPETALEVGAKFMQDSHLDNYEWFVVLHVREATSTLVRGDGNLVLKSYIPAIQEILSRGGAVVRIGNAGMSKIENFDSTLGENPGYFDYANSKFKSEVLDIFLMANCRFMIGTASGPIFIPKEFGKPVLYTNAPSVGMLPDILGYCMPNLYETKSGRSLALSEMLEKAEVGWKKSLSETKFKRLGNSPEDLRTATEFMAKEGHKLLHNDEYDRLNALSAKVRKRHELTSAMRICPTFLSDHSEMLN